MKSKLKRKVVTVALRYNGLDNLADQIESRDIKRFDENFLVEFGREIRKIQRNNDTANVFYRNTELESINELLQSDLNEAHGEVRRLNQLLREAESQKTQLENEIKSISLGKLTFSRNLT